MVNIYQVQMDSQLCFYILSYLTLNNGEMDFVILHRRQGGTEGLRSLLKVIEPKWPS